MACNDRAEYSNKQAHHYLRLTSNICMRVLVFSDTHLTHKFDEAKFSQLYSLLDQSWDKIIINGDFWDGFSTTFDKFLGSKWSDLFPLLKDRTVYIYGNHDRQEYCDERTSHFSKTAADHYQLRVGERDYYITHGHQFFQTSDTKYPILRNKFTNYLVMQTFKWGVGKRGRAYFHKRFYQNGNRLQQQFKLKHLPKDTTLVCGHSHLYEDNQPGYLNSGFIDFGVLDYLVLPTQA